MPHLEPHGFRIRAALILGFGLTFGIWLAAGYYFTKRMSDTQSRAAAINARYMEAQELLSTVRVRVLLGSVFVRDALLDPRPATDDYRRRLEETSAAVAKALEEYVPVLDSSTERERVARLQRDIADFQMTMLQVLSTDSTEWPAQGRTLLRTQIVPKREAVIRVSEEVQTLNRVAFVQQQREVAEIYSANQRRLWASLGLALAASLGIALMAALYAGRLERRIRLQRIRDLQGAQELQDLSAKLITVQEEERRAIARELHDEIGQVLTAIKVELAVAQHTIDVSSGAADLLADARTITEGALTTVRDLSLLLHPAVLDDLGLPAAIEWYLRGFGKRHGIRVEVRCDQMDERLASEIEVSAYRIVQEGLTNVARHARATSCNVSVERRMNTVVIAIEDDGIGFDQTGVEGTGARVGLGLIGIRERALRLRGAARVESAPSRGTRLTVELPVRLRAQLDPGSTPDPVPPAADSLTRQVLHG